MLVITRKIGEEIVVNGDIRIVVNRIQGKQVRIGIEAERDTTIHRKEVQDKIDRTPDQIGEDLRVVQ